MNQVLKGKEENLNNLECFRQVASESCIFPAELSSDHFEIAPGENKIPTSVILYKNCEDLAFAHLFSKGEFRYTAKHETKLSPVKYFNQRLLNYNQIISSCIDYIFLFSLFYNS